MSDNKYLQLSDGETELSRLEGNAYTVSSNPIVRIVMFFVGIIQFLIGSKSKVLVVSTSERLVIIQNQKFLWFFDASVSVRTVFPRGIVQTGYSMARSMIFFKTHYLSMSSGGTSEIFSSKSGKNGVDEMIRMIKSLKEKTSGV